MRPSELWGITWPLAAFYFDRAVRNWAKFVDGRSEEAEMVVRRQMKNRRGTDGFALQAREVTFKKLVGLDTTTSYAAPPTPKGVVKGPKRDVGSVKVPKAFLEGKRIDPSRFAG